MTLSDYDPDYSKKAVGLFNGLLFAASDFNNLLDYLFDRGLSADWAGMEGNIKRMKWRETELVGCFVGVGRQLKPDNSWEANVNHLMILNLMKRLNIACDDFHAARIRQQNSQRELDSADEKLLMQNLSAGVVSKSIIGCCVAGCQSLCNGNEQISPLPIVEGQILGQR